MKNFLLLAMLSFTTLSPVTPSYAQAPRPGAAWYEAAHVLLAVVEPAVGFSGSWQFDRADNGDIRIAKEEQRLGTTISGSVMMICNDSALLTRGLAVPVKGRELGDLDGPVLLLQLALRLLERGIPQGPQSVQSELALNVDDDNNPIRVRRGTAASSDFLAPWKLRGRVTPLGPGKLRYEMKFSYSTPAAKGRQFEMELTGLWQKEGQQPVFDSTTDIADWRVYRIDLASRTVAGNMLLDQMAMPTPIRLKTLGDLRMLIERNWEPRARERRRDACP